MRLDKRREHKVLKDVKGHFLTKVDPSFWWECLRHESTDLLLEVPYQYISKLNIGKKNIWLIPCEDEESVYDVSPDIIINVLEKCPPFEYALVNKKLEWMFVESHHNVLYASGLEAMNRLKSIQRCRKSYN